jgi:hypothetical protein
VVDRYRPHIPCPGLLESFCKQYTTCGTLSASTTVRFKPLGVETYDRPPSQLLSSFAARAKLPAYGDQVGQKVNTSIAESSFAIASVGPYM